MSSRDRSARNFDDLGVDIWCFLSRSMIVDDRELAFAYLSLDWLAICIRANVALVMGGRERPPIAQVCSDKHVIKHTAPSVIIKALQDAGYELPHGLGQSFSVESRSGVYEPGTDFLKGFGESLSDFLQDQGEASNHAVPSPLQ
ncbi:hypothetical protein N2603_36450 [Bradyrhizobium huanghuaihaiense]|uniref:hypothetical protein n=1 Tax=Bradyrhizobium huanghuaihaiense TaxID=990078 RepID=UPI0021A98ABE|nr:hypothetical protein [Bradyrhizobium sp. CB3035]UWU75465.1 hypothetical protein N2603_36450 [Bradyrhizobium sp. CB3035]